MSYSKLEDIRNITGIDSWKQISQSMGGGYELKLPEKSIPFILLDEAKLLINYAYNFGKEALPNDYISAIAFIDERYTRSRGRGDLKIKEEYRKPGHYPYIQLGSAIDLSGNLVDGEMYGDQHFAHSLRIRQEAAEDQKFMELLSNNFAPAGALFDIVKEAFTRQNAK